MNVGLKKIFKKKGTHGEVLEDITASSQNGSADDLCKSGQIDDDEEGDLGDQSNGEHVQARLSLDGELVERERKKQEEALEAGGDVPDQPPISDDPEGTIQVSADHHDLPVHIGSCGSAGWEPLRGPNRRTSVEIRKENQFARDHMTKSLHNHYSNMKLPTGGLENECEEKRKEIHKGRVIALRRAFGEAEQMLRSGELPHSRCILARRVVNPSGKDKFKAVDLSYDQKPSRPDEKKRVRAAGGRIARFKKNLGPLRVWLGSEWIPGLAMTRSIGDTVLSDSGVVPVPEVTFIRLSSEDTFVVLASDGVWEFMTSQEVAEFVGKLRRDGISADEAADALVREAVRRWRRNEVVVDDTTCIIVYLDFPRYNAEGGGARGMKKLFNLGKSSGEKPSLVSTEGKIVAFNPKNDLSN